MDFESPDVMKDFPGLYATEANKKSNDSDYSDDVEKVTKKDLLIGKRKDKKDTKKDRGYAALEGESSAEEDHDAKSPSKSKKTKSFKFTTKTKEKREKVRDKEKDVEKKKDVRKNERCKEKVKCEKKDKKNTKLVNDDKIDIADVLPVFGVNLQMAVERSRCHDGIDLPLPIRNCIDYIQENVTSVENVYKISAIKSKVVHIKKLYNQREHVNMYDYDVPTATSVIKLFFRELPEPILIEYLSRFEEAASIQNVSTREASLIALVDKLPEYNKILLGWTILHLDTITCNEMHTKMNAQSIAMALSPILQMSHRLLAALLCHCKSLFKDTVLFKYCPPLISNSLQLPEDSAEIMCELRKQESLLSQIHAEMNSGFISKNREELLWEVQRMITQLKRKLRSIQKCHKVSQTQKSLDECPLAENSKISKSLSCSDDDTLQSSKQTNHLNNNTINNIDFTQPQSTIINQQQSVDVDEHQLDVMQSSSDDLAIQITNIDTVQITTMKKAFESDDDDDEDVDEIDNHHDDDIDDDNDDNAIDTGIIANTQMPDTAICMIQQQNLALLELKDSLLSQISAEKSEIVLLKYCILNNRQQSACHLPSTNLDTDKLDELMDLLMKENKILQIKKIGLVREIMEQREACIYLQSKLTVFFTNVT